MNNFFFYVFAYIVLLCGCTTKLNTQSDGPPDQEIDVSNIPNAIPKFEPYSTTGNPPFYTVNNQKYIVSKTSSNFQQKGTASWYGKKFHGRTTSNGEYYDMLSMTAAHKELPLPTYLKVTNLDNNKQVIVRVNDRGPFVSNRIIDLSYAAAKKLDMLKKGTANVHLETISVQNLSQGQKNFTLENKLNAIYLQVGAFRNGDKAINYMNKLKRLINYNVVTKVEELQNIAIYKIQIGPIKSIKDSEIAIRSIKKHIHVSPLVIMR